MADRFDKFTERALRVLTYAQQEAQRFNHNYIGTEHILLGLLRESDGVAGHVLLDLGADLTKVRSTIEHIIGRGERPMSGDIGLTPRAKKVIELAVAEARRLGHREIGTEHLLLGLVREDEGIAHGVLASLGITLDSVRTHPTFARGEETFRPTATRLTATLQDNPVVPDAQLRDEARDAVRRAIVTVAGFSGAGLERDLVNALLLPRLTGLMEDLFGQTATVFERDAARRRIFDALRVLAAAAGAFQTHGNEDIAAALNTAIESAGRAVTA
jgi:hypothetical protein